MTLDSMRGSSMELLTLDMKGGLSLTKKKVHLGALKGATLFEPTMNDMHNGINFNYPLKLWIDFEPRFGVPKVKLLIDNFACPQLLLATNPISSSQTPNPRRKSYTPISIKHFFNMHKQQTLMTILKPQFP